MHQDRQHLALAVASEASLLGACASQGDRIDGFEVAGIRDQVNPHLPSTGAGVHARRADVILHVAAAQHAARIDIFEAGEDLGRRAASRC